MAGCLSLAVGWQIWLMMLGSANMFAPPVFPESHRSAPCADRVSAFLYDGLILVKLQEFTGLLGLMHIIWIPLVIIYGASCPSILSMKGRGIWISSVIVLNTVSLIFDTADVTRYPLGERAPLHPLPAEN